MPRVNGLRSKIKALGVMADNCKYYEQHFSSILQNSRNALQASFEMLAELQIRYSSSK
jgi:hypothetical protein